MTKRRIDAEALERVKILFCDDETLILLGVARILGRICGEIKTASKGEEALSFFLSDKPDLLITDLVMPGMDGWTLVERIREHDTSTPIITLSAHDEDVRKAEGSDLHIRKPVTKEELTEAIRAFMHP
ncbi:response regulator [Limisalsivibrio acetivorans]|uniref:response regulator n=1 Tax=Limisalsivibrio acetivorans TaxID=1304888 RepID=UPI0003B40CB2|nr:response regulator transcription factor [Limisalsivibrio acetivorans]